MENTKNNDIEVIKEVVEAVGNVTLLLNGDVSKEERQKVCSALLKDGIETVEIYDYAILCIPCDMEENKKNALIEEQKEKAPEALKVTEVIAFKEEQEKIFSLFLAEIMKDIFNMSNNDDKE